MGLLATEGRRRTGFHELRGNSHGYHDTKDVWLNSTSVVAEYAKTNDDFGYTVAAWNE
jgi:hypothetical protein